MSVPVHYLLVPNTCISNQKLAGWLVDSELAAVLFHCLWNKLAANSVNWQPPAYLFAYLIRHLLGGRHGRADVIFAASPLFANSELAIFNFVRNNKYNIVVNLGKGLLKTRCT